MSETLLRALLGALVIMAIAGVWIAGVMFVAGDAHRRGLSFWLRLFWVICALLPMVGLTAYLYYYYRPAARALGHTGTQSRLRITLPAAPAGLREPQPPRQATMPVAALRGLHVATSPVPAMAREAAAPNPMPIRLAVVEGPHSGQEFAVGALPAQIGRGAEVMVRLDGDLGVSRRH